MRSDRLPARRVWIPPTEAQEAQARRDLALASQRPRTLVDVLVAELPPMVAELRGALLVQRLLACPHVRAAAIVRSVSR